MVLKNTVANSVKDKGIGQQHDNVINFKLFLLQQFIGKKGQVKGDKKYKGKGERQAEVIVHPVSGTIPKKKDGPCESKGGVIKGLPVFFEGNGQDSDIDDRHVGKEHRNLSGTVAQQKGNGIGAYQSNVGNDLSVVMQGGHHCEHGKDDHEHKSENLGEQAIEGIGRVGNEI
tara:strand:- start:112 stop:627 length:516 start_codon:yes stop_codon:yes gene_type:complete